MADPAARLVQHLADRILEPHLAAGCPHDGEALAVRRPVGPLDLLQDVAGSRPAGDRELRQRAGAAEWSRGEAVQGHGHLARLGDREDFGAREAERPRLRALGPADEDLHGLAFPGRRVHDRLPVRSESRRKDLATAKVSWWKDGRRLASHRAAEDEGAAAATTPRAAVTRTPRRRDGRARLRERPRPSDPRRRRGPRRSKARSCAEWKRSSGFFSRQCRTMRSRPGWMFLLVAERSGGSSLRIADIESAAESPLERPLARQHLVEDRAEGEEVASARRPASP